MLLVNTGEGKEFRFGVPEENYEAWLALHERTGLPQRRILYRLIEFILAQDDVTQAVILGTVRPKEDVLELALRRMAKAKKPTVKGRITQD